MMEGKQSVLSVPFCYEKLLDIVVIYINFQVYLLVIILQIDFVMYTSCPIYFMIILIFNHTTAVNYRF